MTCLQIDLLKDNVLSPAAPVSYLVQLRGEMNHEDVVEIFRVCSSTS